MHGRYWVAKRSCTRLAVEFTGKSDTAAHHDLNEFCRGRDRQATPAELAHFRAHGDVDSNARNVKLVRLDHVAKCAAKKWELPAEVRTALEHPVHLTALGAMAGPPKPPPLQQHLPLYAQHALAVAAARYAYGVAYFAAARDSKPCGAACSNHSTAGGADACQLCLL